MRYRINPEWKEARYELCHYPMVHDNQIYPLRFRESDFAMAVKLSTQGNIMELYKLAIGPLIIENETTPQKA